MITSRKQGILVINTTIPYKMAKNGVIDEVTEVICHEITYAVESIAYDIEQMFLRAIISLSKNRNISDQINSKEDEKKEIDSYFNDESPSSEVISENAKSLAVLFKMSDVNMSDLIKLFDKIVDAGLICAEGDIKMSTKNIWFTISRQDRLDIVFKYISFFVKPLLQA